MVGGAALLDHAPPRLAIYEVVVTLNGAVACGEALLGAFLGLGILGARLGGKAQGRTGQPGFGGRAYSRGAGRQRGGRDLSAWSALASGSPLRMS